MDQDDIKHLIAGLALALLGALSLCFGFYLWVSMVIALLLAAYIVLIIVQCAICAKHGITDKTLFGLPNRTWALLLIVFFVISNVCAFSNIYIKSRGISHDVGGERVVMEDKLDAVYFSTVTLTTLGYGDFTPNKDGRIYVVFQLFTGLLLLLLAIPVVASRISNW